MCIQVRIGGVESRVKRRQEKHNAPLSDLLICDKPRKQGMCEGNVTSPKAPRHR